MNKARKKQGQGTHPQNRPDHGESTSEGDNHRIILWIRQSEPRNDRNDGNRHPGKPVKCELGLQQTGHEICEPDADQTAVKRTIHRPQQCNCHGFYFNDSPRWDPSSLPFPHSAHEVPPDRSSSRATRSDASDGCGQETNAAWHPPCAAERSRNTDAPS
jgi:hypothetical protein